MNRLLAGSIAGVAATVPMTALMVFMHRRIPPGERKMLPPKQVAGKVASEAGAGDLVDREDELLATTGVTHFGYGAAMGGAYAMASPYIDLPAELKGTAFGLCVWAGSYLGWLPAAGIRPPATRRPVSENAMMIASHIVYGIVLGRLVESLAGDGTGAAPKHRR
jgi:uncharacterized membrane protein YagU involved in acid resistance